MTSEKLQRTSYRDPNTPDNRVRSGTPTLAENEQDMDQYYRPLERIHGSSLHGWGVASGLGVTATLNSATLTIQPGVALDRSGQHIALAVGGNAEVGKSPTGFSTGATFVPVTASGVTMPTSGLTGDKYLTIQFWETFDSDSYNNLGLFRYFHTPWLQLVDATGFTNDGSRVVLAKVSFGTGATAGQVTALSQELRQATDLPVGSIHLQRMVTSSPAANVETVDTTEAGVIRAYASGGIDVTVPNSTDEIHLERDDGGNFAKVSLGAEKIVARQGNGTESVIIDTEAGNITTQNGTVSASNLTATGTIQGGSITATGKVGIGTASPNNQLVTASQASFGGNTSNTGSEPIEVQGSGAGVSFYDRTGGATGRWVIYSDRTGGAGTETLRFWSAGDKVTITQGGDVDISGSASIGGSASIDGDLTVFGNLFGRHGDATNALHTWLYALNSTITIDVNLGVSQQVFALIVLPGVRGGSQSFSALAYIDSVDGQPLPGPGDPAHASWNGNAQTIRFGLSTSAIEAWALAIVFTQ